MNEFERRRRTWITDDELAREVAKLTREIETLGRDIAWHRRSIVQAIYLSLAGLVLALVALGMVAYHMLERLVR